MACNLTYNNLSVIGACETGTLGSVSFDVNTTAFPVVVSDGLTILATIQSSAPFFTQNNLPAGNYTYTITDSCTPTNESSIINFVISDGTCINITGTMDTSCGLNNGSITATTASLYGSATFSLYNESGLVNSVSTNNNNYVFNNLSYGLYYVIGDDGGGCTGMTQSCYVKSSSTLDFGFYVVNNPGCSVNVGKIFVTGLTGVAPYTYLWSNGSVASSISGLTSGNYNVKITDSNGCSVTKGVQVTDVPKLSVGPLIVSQQPTCFGNDGEVIVNISGGTPPYYYQSIYNEITLSQSVIFTGLSSGLFSVIVTDAGLCTASGTTQILPPNSFSVLSINTINSTCNDSSGRININIVGNGQPFTYTLTDSSGNTQTIVQNSTSASFTNLSSGIYTITISDNTNTCTYVGTYIINNTPLISISAQTTGTTCNLSNGSVTLFVSGGNGNYSYEISSGQIVNSSLSSYTFNNLSSGSYVGTITNLQNFCSEDISFNITPSTSVDFTLFPVNTSTGNDGEIYAFITSGTPPFILNWSSNVGAQTGLHITGLTAGTYSLTVIDDSGCTQTRNVEVGGYSRFNTTQTYNICTDIFADAGLLQRGAKQMLIEGFYDLTSGDTNCILNQAIFTIETILSGETKTQSFYTGTTLNDSPSAFLWGEVVTELLQSYGNVGEVIANVIENNVQIFSDCSSELPLMDVSAIVNLKISYDISCEQCDGLFAAVLNDMSLGCETNVPPIEYSLTFNYSITGGSGNYELQFYSGSTWVTFYSFTGPINGIPSVDVGPVIADITDVTPNSYDWRIYDVDYTGNSASFNSSIPNCVT